MKYKPSDGLFVVDCDSCHKSFPAENSACECGANKGELNLDIDKMLNQVYELNADNKLDSAIDIIFDVYYQLYDRFDVMNNILDKVDVSKLDSNLLVAFLTQTFKYAEQVSNHNIFCDKAANRLREMGYDEDKIHRLVDDFRSAGNYWNNMSALAAPESLTGPKPKN